MRVQQDDFVGFRAVDLAGMAQAQHVFVLALAFIAHTGLRHHEGLKPFLAKLGQHCRRGDIGVPLRTALMRGIRKDGRRYGESGHPTGDSRNAARGMGSETGSELHGLSPDKRGLLFTHTGFQDSGPAFVAVRWSARGTRLALLPPSFLSSSPATVRSARTGPSRRKAQGWCGPQAQPRTRPCAP